MFKWIKRIIIGIVLLVVIVVVGTVVMLHKDMKIDTSSYDDAKLMDYALLQEKLGTSFDDFLANAGTNAEFKVGITQDDVNQMLKTMVFDNMATEEAYKDGTDYTYFFKTDYYAIQGGSVSFKKDTIEIVVGFHAFLGSIKYKSGITLAFEFESAGEEMIFKLTKLNVGKMPLLWARGLANKIVKKFSDQSIEEMIQDALKDIGEFSLEDASLTVNVKDIVEGLMSDSSDNAGIAALMFELLYQNELFDLGVEDKQITAKIELEKLRDNNSYSLTSTFANDEEINALFQAKISALVVTILVDAKPFIAIDELTLNKLVEYYFNDYSSGDQLMSFEYDKIKIEVNSPFVELDDFVYVNLPISVYSKEEPSNSFNTVIKLKTEMKQNGEDLLFDIKGITIGEINITDEQVNVLLDVFGENELFEDGALVIKGFTKMIVRDDFGVNEFKVEGNLLILKVNLSSAINIDDIKQTVEDVLGEITSSTTISDEVKDSINDVLSSLPNGDIETITENIESFADLISNLPEDEQKELYSEVEDALESHGYTMEDIFELFGVK